MQLPGGPDLDQTIKLVQHDPVVVTRLLRIVNSAFYGQRGQVTNINRAVLVLGASQAVGTVMAMSLVELRTAYDARTAVPFLNLVRHSIAAGFLTQQLYSREVFRREAGFRPESMSEAFTAGIIHDFGKMVLLYNYPEQAGILYLGEVPAAGNLLETERELFGYDHVQTGLYFADRVNFPDALLRSIALHHNYQDLADSNRDSRMLVYATALANEATHVLGYGLDYEVTAQELENSPAAELLAAEQVLYLKSSNEIARYLLDQKDQLAAYVDMIV